MQAGDLFGGLDLDELFPVDHFFDSYVARLEGSRLLTLTNPAKPPAAAAAAVAAAAAAVDSYTFCARCTCTPGQQETIGASACSEQ